MYSLKPSTRYRKSIKKLLMSGSFKIDDLDRILNLLASNEPLEAKHQNHRLQGKYKDCFECHVKSDLLLIYKIDTENQILLVVDIGSHSDLFE